MQTKPKTDKTNTCSFYEGKEKFTFTSTCTSLYRCLVEWFINNVTEYKTSY